MGKKIGGKKLVSGTVGVLVSLGMMAFSAGIAGAAGTVTVTPSNTQGWSTADSTAGGAVNFVADPTAPAGNGALELTTDLTTSAKAQYFHAASTSLSDITDLSYYTKQVSVPFPGADPSYQLAMFLNGASGFTTLVFEPYQNPAEGAVVNGAWQNWDVDQGLFWSTRTVTCSNGTILGTAGGPAAYTLAQVKASCPDAVVVGYGVNIGSNNPGYTVDTDLFNFNGTAYDFEVTSSPADKDQCKNGGYANYTDSNGQPFKNQGQCVSFTQHELHNQ